jgi:hypothetical protein
LPERNASSILSQSFILLLPVTTAICQGWALTPEGAVLACSIIALTTSIGTSLSTKARVDFRSSSCLFLRSYFFFSVFIIKLRQAFAANVLIFECLNLYRFIFSIGKNSSISG